MNNNGVAIEVRQLHKSYFRADRELSVLNGVSVTFLKGEMVAITGVSGVGKSTLLHILGTLDVPSSGDVIIDGQNPFQMTPSRIAAFRNKTIGFIFQAHHLLPEFSACENVMVPLLIHRCPAKQARERAEKILIDVGLEERMEHKPGELSGGEQQRVAVARALVNEPLIIVADEPTGNLDEGTGRTIHNLLKQINQQRGITFVLATHNLRLAAEADRQFRLAGGMLSDESLTHGVEDV